jgi:hypothetical protein
MTSKTACCGTCAGLLLATATAAQAHSLHPAYFPLGPLPIMIAVESRPMLLLIPLAITATALVLWLWVRPLGFVGNLWRAAVLYLAARLGEMALIYLSTATAIFSHAGWSSSVLENFVPLAVFLAGGLALAVSAGRWLYRRSGVSAGRVVLAVVTSSLAGYLIAFGAVLLLMKLRGY